MSQSQRLVGKDAEQCSMRCSSLCHWWVGPGHYPMVMFGSVHLSCDSHRKAGAYATLRKTHTILACLLSGVMPSCGYCPSPDAAARTAIRRPTWLSINVMQSPRIGAWRTGSQWNATTSAVRHNHSARYPRCIPMGMNRTDLVMTWPSVQFHLRGSRGPNLSARRTCKY
jgi:hypothetical protein